MASLTAEQIEQKKQQLKQLMVEAQAIRKELAEAGVVEFSDDEVSQVAGGIQAGFFTQGGKGEWGRRPEEDKPKRPKSHYL